MTVMKLTVHRCDTNRCREREPEICGVIEFRHRFILTWNAFAIILSTTVSIDKRLNVIAGELIFLHISIANQLRSYGTEGIAIAIV